MEITEDKILTPDVMIAVRAQIESMAFSPAVIYCRSSLLRKQRCPRKLKKRIKSKLNGIFDITKIN